MLPVLIKLRQPDGGVIFVNANLVSTIGKNRADIRGQTVLAVGGIGLVVDHTIEEVVEMIRSATCSGVPLEDMQ